MNSHRWLSLLLLLCVLCFALFSASFTAYGATEKVEIDTKATNLKVANDTKSANLNASPATSSSSGTHTIDYTLFARKVSNNEYEPGSIMGDITYNYPFERGLVYPNFNVRDFIWSHYLLCDTYAIYRTDGTVMGSKGMTLRLQMNNIGNGIQQGSSSSSYTKIPSVISGYNQVRLRLESPNGSSKYAYFSPSDVLSNSTKYPNDAINLYIEYDLPIDVVKVEVEINYKPSSAFPQLNTSNAWIYKTSAFNTNNGYSEIGLYLQTDNAGLLNKIINGITELPSKLWNLIENGLKGLFVPTESEMTEIKNQWDTLLSDRFGGLYQTVQLIDDYAASFKDPTDKNTITLPELKLPFGQSEFVFGGQDVQIVPDKFSFLITAIKTIISIIATCLFVNGLRNRFERLVGGEE